MAFFILVSYPEIVVHFSSFPPPAFPPINRLSSVAVDAIGISIVSFAINISMAKMFAQKHGYALIPNQVSVLLISLERDALKLRTH